MNPDIGIKGWGEGISEMKGTAAFTPPFPFHSHFRVTMAPLEVKALSQSSNSPLCSGPWGGQGGRGEKGGGRRNSKRPYLLLGQRTLKADPEGQRSQSNNRLCPWGMWREQISGVLTQTRRGSRVRRW